MILIQILFNYVKNVEKHIFLIIKISAYNYPKIRFYAYFMEILHINYLVFQK